MGTSSFVFTVIAYVIGWACRWVPRGECNVNSFTPTEALSNLHAEAWGKPWPHKSRCTTTKDEIVNDKTGLTVDDDLDFKEGPLRDILHIPASCQYD